ncbi:hypothetical protein ACWC0A_30700 [Streptomyces scopuliridis]
MSQPAWKAELRTTVDAWTAGGSIVREGAFAALMPHIEAAFKRGEDAAKLREGSRLVQENERLRRELRRTAEAQQPTAGEPPCCSDPTCACVQVSAEGLCECTRWENGRQRPDAATVTGESLFHLPAKEDADVIDPEVST